MLYGMDDDNKEDFSHLTENKFNNKKIVIKFPVIIIIAIIIFGVGGWKLVSFILEKNQNSKIEETPNQVEETIIIPKEEKKDKNSYDGTHKQIAIHDIEKIKENFIPKPNPDAQNLIKEIYTSEEKQVYLTFDDGPSKDVTPAILDVLKENDVKATFFVLGARVELYPKTLKREFEEGHYIANHGYSHNYSSLYASKENTYNEFVQCENTIKTALENSEYNSYLFRFPGGSSGGKYEKVKSESREFMKEAGIAYTNWNCLTGDAEGKETKEECINEMIRTKEGQNSIILLMHDSNDKTQTVEALPEIIKYFKDEGYTFKTFYEIFR